MSKHIIDVEICVDSVESAIAAAEGGAKRIELCSAANDWGTTPSGGLINAVRAAVKIDLFVMIRPRGGDFVYTDHELDVMQRDILEAKSRMVDGVALGVLTERGYIDIERTRNLIEMARPLQVTFHRAFDNCQELDRALEDVITSGADRILTAGGQRDAVMGMTKLAHLQTKADGRIAIMAGGGIRTSNVRTIALNAGIREVHTSLSKNLDNLAIHHSSRAERRTCRVLEDDVRGFKGAVEEIARMRR
jgi:copper homeostasis protein